MLSSQKSSLLKACNGIMYHVEGRYALLGLYFDYATKEEPAQLNALFIKDGSRKMLERKNYYAAHTVCSSVAFFVNRSAGSESSRDLIRLNAK